MKNITFILFLVSCITFINPIESIAATEETRHHVLPQFKYYPAIPPYTGPAAKLVIDKGTKPYRTVLSWALTNDNQPEFAGEYVKTTFGCGTECVITVFINKRTGKALERSFGGEQGPFITDYKIDSNLIVSEGPIINQDFEDIGLCAKFYYLLDKEKLNLIRATSAECSPNQ